MIVDGRPDAEHEIEAVDDLDEALRRVQAEDTRLIIRREGEPIAALIPLLDLRLLLKLEEDELDRIAVDEIRHAEADPEDQGWIPLDRVRQDLGL